MLVYIEFISRRPGVSVEQFHHTARLQDRWSDAHGDDALLLNLGRTFRTGPDPEYLAVWYTAKGGLERIGDWERVFQAHEADDLQVPFSLGGRIEKAGCYEPLLEPVGGGGGPYYAEYFDLASEAGQDDVRSFYRERRERFRQLELNLVCDRIGGLGPEPRGLAIWSIGSWDKLDGIARDLDGIESPVRLVAAGLYRDLGSETL